MRPALWSVAIQAAGSAATVASALLVASQMGLAAQGEFGLLRSWNDALVSLAVVGLPQGLLHMQYRESVPVAALRSWVGRYLASLATVFAVLAGAAWWVLPMAPFSTAFVRHPSTVIALAGAVALGAAHLLWRSLALREIGVVRYAAITAAPALLLLLALVPVGMAGRAGGFVWALFAAAAISATASGLMVRRIGRLTATAPSGFPRWSRHRLWSVSAETGAQGVLTALSPALMLSIAGWLGAPLAEIGAVSLGLHVYLVFGVASAYVAPMVYDRAARAEQTPSTRQLVHWVRQRARAPLLLALGAAALLALLLIRWLWPAGAGSLVLLSAMAVAGVLSMAVRLIVTLLLARGAFRPVTVQAVVRLLATAGGTALLMQIWSATLAAPLALAFTELLLLGWLLWLVRPEASARPAR